MKSKLGLAEKQIIQLNQKISEKDSLISTLKEEIKRLGIKKDKFEILNIENKVIDMEIVGLFECKNIDDNGEENKMLKEKIKKMKNAITELSIKLEKELLIKEQKNIKINESNSKLFEELQKKNKELMRMLRQENLQTMALRKEKYDLETICIKQEDTIRLLNKKISIKSNSLSAKKKLKQCLYSDSNIFTQNERLPEISNNLDSIPKMKFKKHNKSGFLPTLK